jgi:transcription elongation factor Elf1
MSSINQQQNTSDTQTKVSPVKSNLKKHRELLGRYIKCKYCESDSCRIYLEDNRYRISCVVCGYNGYLKEQHI